MCPQAGICCCLSTVLLSVGEESCGLLLIFEELGVSGLEASNALGDLNSAVMECVNADTRVCRCACCSCPGSGP